MGLLDYFRSPPPAEPAELHALRAEVGPLRELVQEAVFWGRFNSDPYYRSTATDTPLLLETDDLSLEGLAQTREVARRLCRRNPFAICALKNVVNFVVSADGMKLTATTKDKASQPLVDAVQDVLDEFAERTLWVEWQQEIVRRTVRDGEALVRWFELPGGYLDLRAIEPDWLQEPKQPPCEGHWDKGVCFAEDKTTPIAYWVVYPGEAGELVDAEHVVHFKANVDRNVTRGLSDFCGTAEVLDGIQELLTKLRVGEGVRAAIAGFWEYENATASQVASRVGELKDQIQRRGNAPNPITGKTDNYQRTEPGSILHVPKGKQFKPPPDSPASAAQIEVEKACLRSVAARWNMPEYMISADASNQNYSSILIAGAPFTREVRTQQGYFKARFLIIVWKAIELAARAGRILNASWQQVEHLTEVQAEPPAPELSNELESAQVDQIDMAAGVLSKQTRRMRLGLDSEQERANLQEEPVSQPMGFGGLAIPEPVDRPTPAEAADKPTEQAAPNQADAVAGNDLRTTVGGLNAVAGLQDQYYAGKLPREAAVANVKVLLGFTDAEAASLFPEIAPVKLAPSEPSPVVESLSFLPPPGLDALADAFLRAKKRTEQ